MNRDDFLFKIHYFLENLALIDKGFTYNITHDSNNEVTGIVWMTSYMRDNFERFGNYLSIDVIRSSVCNAKEFCYSWTRLEKINVVCGDFIRSKNS